MLGNTGLYLRRCSKNRGLRGSGLTEYPKLHTAAPLSPYMALSYRRLGPMLPLVKTGDAGGACPPMLAAITPEDSSSLRNSLKKVRGTRFTSGQRVYAQVSAGAAGRSAMEASETSWPAAPLSSEYLTREWSAGSLTVRSR